MTLAEIQHEIAMLPRLMAPKEKGAEEKGASQTPSTNKTNTPLEIVARQGRLIMRLSASLEGMEARQRELAESVRERNAQAHAETESRKETERRLRQMALETIRLMDMLDWVHISLTARENPFAQEVFSAQRECLRRLASIGITEIPVQGEPDGRLHETVDTMVADSFPQYHIVSVVRRGYQYGAEILRRAEVITAEVRGADVVPAEEVANEALRAEPLEQREAERNSPRVTVVTTTIEDNSDTITINKKTGQKRIKSE
jgi:molecular chaperone GrpE (heat shock protein)